MYYQTAMSELSKVSSRFNLMVVMVIALLITNILMASLAWYAMFHQKREIVPFNDTKGYISSASMVDAHFLDKMALNFIYTRLNVTPKTVSHNHKWLLNYVNQTEYHDFLNILNVEQKRILERNISSSFALDNVKSLPSELTTIVSGTLRRWVGLRELDVEQVHYKLKFQYKNGNLTLSQFIKEKGVGND